MPARGARPGRPLEPAVRAEMEDRLGHDFRRVRIHRDPAAERFASSLAARAATVGRDIFFDRAQYRPDTPRGRHLLAHELVHTVQQEGAGPPAAGGLEVVPPTDRSETEAEAAARDAEAGSVKRTVRASRGPLRIQRFWADIPILGVFFEHDYEREELQRYLEGLDQREEIEGGLAGDDKARQVVEEWSDGSNAYDLPVRRKALLIHEMLDGWVSPDDQEQILNLLERSESLELDHLFGPAGVRHAELLDEFGTWEEELHAFYRRRFGVGRDEEPTAARLADATAVEAPLERGDPLPDPEQPIVFDPFVAGTTGRRKEYPGLAEIDAWVNRIWGDQLPAGKRPKESKGYLEREVSLQVATPDRETGRLERYIEYCRGLSDDPEVRERCEQIEPTVEGFYDEEERTAVVRHGRGGVRPAAVVHEALHGYEHDATDRLNKFAREGLIEYLTRRLVEHSAGSIDQRLVGSHTYPGPYQAALELALIAGEARIARAVFQGAIGALEKAVGEETFAAWNEALELDDGWREAVALLRRSQRGAERAAEES